MNIDINPIVDVIAELIKAMPIAERIQALNEARKRLHAVSPFANEPIDFVRWVPAAIVTANDYNPNSVAPPEMELLRVSIMADGYTQPVVTHAEEGQLTVVDGFHRTRVGKELADVKARVHGFLPVVQIRKEQADKADRIASTIRHNRARGKHRVDAMSDIVVELKRRNWSDEKIASNLGMDADEVLRLCQITGLAELFSDQEFSKSWDVEGEITEADFVELTDDITTYGEESESFRTLNTDDENRIFHTYDKWECQKAGFYQNTKDGISKSDGEESYRVFLSDIPRFSAALDGVLAEWKNSCEHYLTNSAMNRVAWLGQAAMCYATGIPAAFRSGFSLLKNEQQDAANQVALTALNKWLANNGREPVTMDEAYSGRQAEIY